MRGSVVSHFAAKAEKLFLMSCDNADGRRLHFGDYFFGGQGCAADGTRRDFDVILFEELLDLRRADGEAVAVFEFCAAGFHGDDADDTAELIEQGAAAVAGVYLSVDDD